MYTKHVATSRTRDHISYKKEKGSICSTHLRHSDQLIEGALAEVSRKQLFVCHPVFISVGSNGHVTDLATVSSRQPPETALLAGQLMILRQCCYITVIISFFDTYFRLLDFLSRYIRRETPALINTIFTSYMYICICTVHYK